MNKKTSSRQSNIELLRIIAMIMIVMFHMGITDNTIRTGNTAKVIFATILSTLGLIGVNIFILITGYFQIEKEFQAKKVIKIWLQTIFYSALMMVICRYLNIVKIDIKVLSSTFLPVTYPEYWFISSYILLYIFSPFINKFAKCLKQQEYKNLLILTTVLFSIAYTFLFKSAYTASGSWLGNLAWFAYIYLLAGYIKLYGIKFLDNRKILIILIIVVFIIYEALILFIAYAEIKTIKSILISFNSCFVLTLSVLIFCLFKNLHVKKSKIINYLGSVTLAVYFIHEHYIFRYRWWKIIRQATAISKIEILNVLYEMMAGIVIAFCIACVTEAIRRKIENKIFNIKWVNSELEKIDEKYIGNKTK